MRFDVLSLFPELIEAHMNFSIMKRACAGDIIELVTHNPRDYTLDKHKKVDDTPYGGGVGMVLMPQPYVDCYESIEKYSNSITLMMTPQGEPFNDAMSDEFAHYDQIIILCGHYEGFDERIRSICDLEISIGDYVLTGGEIASMAIIDSIVRLIPGVIEEESHVNDSFNDNLLDYPTYTKPRVYEGMEVPEVLVSGDHKKIAEWRKEESLKRTRERRPDLLD